MSLFKRCAWYLLEDYVHIHECVLYVEVFPSNTGHQFPGVQCSTQNTRSDHCQCVCSGFLHFQVLSHSVCSGHCHIFERLSTTITLECVQSVPYCVLHRSYVALRPLSHIWNLFHNDHTWMWYRVVHRCYVALRQAGNWWKWQFLHGAQIINGQFLVPCYSLPMTMFSLLLPCMTLLSLPVLLSYPI